MDIKTTFSNGDKGWIFTRGYVQEVTIGQVRVVVTDSPGTCDDTFSNYGPQKGSEETYMCIETGVGSGTVYTIGKHIFATKAECETAYAVELAEKEAEKERAKESRRSKLVRDEANCRAQLALLQDMLSREQTA